MDKGTTISTFRKWYGEEDVLSVPRKGDIATNRCRNGGDFAWFENLLECEKRFSFERCTNCNVAEEVLQ